MADLHRLVVECLREVRNGCRPELEIDSGELRKRIGLKRQADRPGIGLGRVETQQDGGRTATHSRFLAV